MNIFEKRFKADTSIVIIPDFHINMEDPVEAERAAKMEAKRIAAKKWLGKKWILHPVNQTRKPKKMKDFATDLRQAFIRAVK